MKPSLHIAILSNSISNESEHNRNVLEIAIVTNDISIGVHLIL